MGCSLASEHHLTSCSSFCCWLVFCPPRRHSIVAMEAGEVGVAMDLCMAGMVDGVVAGATLTMEWAATMEVTMAATGDLPTLMTIRWLLPPEERCWSAATWSLLVW